MYIITTSIQQILLPWCPVTMVTKITLLGMIKYKCNCIITLIIYPYLLLQFIFLYMYIMNTVKPVWKVTSI